MKENFRAFDRLINISRKNTLLNLSRIINICLLSFLHIFSKILIKAGLLYAPKRDYIIICVRRFLRVSVVKLGELINSSFIKRSYERTVLKFTSAFILAISIFFISILSVNVNFHHFINSFYNDDYPIYDKVCRKANDYSNLSIYDVYQPHSNDQIIFKPLTKKVFITPYVLANKISTRAPPV